MAIKLDGIGAIKKKKENIISCLCLSRGPILLPLYTNLPSRVCHCSSRQCAGGETGLLMLWLSMQVHCLEDLNGALGGEVTEPNKSGVQNSPHRTRLLASFVPLSLFDAYLMHPLTECIIACVKNCIR